MPPAQQCQVLVRVDPCAHILLAYAGIVLLQQVVVDLVQHCQFNMRMVRFKGVLHVALGTVAATMIMSEVAIVGVSFPAPALPLFEVMLMRIIRAGCMSWVK